MRSQLGLVLNELGDVLADAALYLPFAVVPGVNGWLVVTLVVASIISEMAGVVVTQVGSSRRYDGPLGKSDRAFLFGLVALLLGCETPPGWWLDALLGVAIALSLVTTIRRARRGLKAERT